jgi:hypothetical protein
VSAQNNQLFGYATESEDVVIRRVSRRVMRYLDVLQTLPQQVLAPQKSVLLPLPLPAASRSPAVRDEEIPLVENTEPEFAEDIPTHVSFARAEGSAHSTEDTPSVVVPLSFAPLSGSLPPLPVLPVVPAYVPPPPVPPVPPVPASASSSPGLKPPPPPLKVKEEVEVLVKAPNPVAIRKSQSLKSSAQSVASKEPKTTSIKSAAVTQSASSHMALSSPPQAMQSDEDSSIGAPTIALLIASAALLLAGLVYWLLTFDKFVY